MRFRNPAASGLIRRLLAALLLVQAVLAPALGLRAAAAGQGHSVAICTPEGVVERHLPGAPAEDAPAREGACLACHALPQGAEAAAPALHAPAWALVRAAWTPGGPEAPPPAIRGPPSGARAPPIAG